MSLGSNTLLLPTELWELIAAATRHQNTYCTLIRLCKQTHWLPVDDSTFYNALKTYGIWRLPKDGFTHVNRTRMLVAASCRIATAYWDHPGAILAVIDYKMRAITFKLPCGTRVNKKI